MNKALKPAPTGRLAALWLAWKEALLGTEPRQQHRLAMFGLATLHMACCMAAMYIVTGAGLADKAAVSAWMGLCVAGMAVIYALIRSGVSQRFRDPSLTGPQIIYAITCDVLAFVILAAPARGIALPILAVIVMFGIFGLTPRQMVGVMCYALAAFGAATVLMDWRGYNDQKPALSVAYGIIIVVVLIGSTFLSQTVQLSRQRLRRQRQELAQALEQIRLLATHDELTGLPNRRHMIEVIQQAMGRADHAAPAGQPLLLVQLDVDHFKAINDSHGHAVGDLVLQALARAARAGVRKGDQLARWGGEEFVLLLSETSRQEASALLERLRLAVAVPQTLGPLGLPLSVTVSMGVASLRTGESLDSALDRADRALYAAKAGGRNRVVWAD